MQHTLPRIIDAFHTCVIFGLSRVLGITNAAMLAARRRDPPRIARFVYEAHTNYSFFFSFNTRMARRHRTETWSERCGPDRAFTTDVAVYRIVDGTCTAAHRREIQDFLDATVHYTHPLQYSQYMSVHEAQWWLRFELLRVLPSHRFVSSRSPSCMLIDQSLVWSEETAPSFPPSCRVRCSNAAGKCSNAAGRS